MTSARVPAAVLSAALLVLSACAGRVVKTPVFQDENVEVFLRQRVKGGEPVDRGFSHPTTLSAVRLTNILSRIEVRKDEEDAEREPAIPTALLFGLGEGLSQALEKADPSQEAVAMATERRRSTLVFTNDYLTSLVAWVQGDKLYVYLGSLDEALSRDPKDRPPEPDPEQVKLKKQAVSSDVINAVGPRTVAASWRDPVFSDVGAVRMRATGQVIRRTILMEDAPEEPGGPKEAPLPGTTTEPLPAGLTPEALRALADLEETRRRGQLTEADYQTQRRQILSGESAPNP